MAVDGVTGGVVLRVLDVVEHQVEVAAQAECHHLLAESLIHGILQLGENRGVRLRGEAVMMAGMRGAHDMRDAIGKRRLDHSERDIQSASAVVQAGEQVMVDINHAIEWRGPRSWTGRWGSRR